MVNIIAIFIFLLVLGLSINTVRSAENYNSSKSNTVTSIAKVHEHVGNILLPYGVGGMEINRVNDALDVGITGDALKAMLGEVLGNVGLGTASGEGVSDKIQVILLEFDKLGIGEEGAEGISAPDAIGASPSASEGTLKDILPSDIIPRKEVSTPGTGDIPQSGIINQEKHRPPASATTPQQPSASEARENVKKEFGSLDSETRSGGFIKLGDLPGKRAAFEDSSIKSIQDLRAAESKEQREDARKELRANRQTLQESIQTLRQNLRENAKDLRENFRENIKTTIGHVDHGKTARIAVAHGKGLRMINRYRSAIARFDHILGRMESRIEKIRIEGEAQARAKGKVKDAYPPDNKAILILIEEAKNTQILNKAKLAELEAKYESLLLGENTGGIAKEAREIAKELKAEIEKLHGQLRAIADEIKQADKNYNSSISNTK